MGEAEVLMALYGFGGLSIPELVSLLDMNYVSVFRVLKRLMGLGLVVRSVRVGRGRHVVYSLSGRGGGVCGSLVRDGFVLVLSPGLAGLGDGGGVDENWG